MRLLSGDILLYHVHDAITLDALHFLEGKALQHPNHDNMGMVMKLPNYAGKPKHHYYMIVICDY